VNIVPRFCLKHQRVMDTFMRCGIFVGSNCVSDTVSNSRPQKALPMIYWVPYSLEEEEEREEEQGEEEHMIQLARQSIYSI